MTDITVNPIELEANYHPYDDHSALSGNTGSKKIVVITPWEKINKLSKPNNRLALQKELNIPKGEARPAFQREPNTPKESKGGEIEYLKRVMKIHLKIMLIK